MPVSIDLSKSSDVVRNDVVKKAVFDKLVAKVNSIDTGGIFLKTNYDTDKKELEKKIPDTSGLAKINQFIMLKSMKYRVKYRTKIEYLMLVV